LLERGVLLCQAVLVGADAQVKTGAQGFLSVGA
jgi:hypothetical protein